MFCYSSKMRSFAFDSNFPRVRSALSKFHINIRTVDSIFRFHFDYSRWIIQFDVILEFRENTRIKYQVMILSSTFLFFFTLPRGFWIRFTRMSWCLFGCLSDNMRAQSITSIYTIEILILAYINNLPWLYRSIFLNFLIINSFLLINFSIMCTFFYHLKFFANQLSFNELIKRFMLINSNWHYLIHKYRRNP